MTSSSAMRNTDAPAIDLQIEQHPLKLSGWAAAADRLHAADELLLTLTAGSLLLGRLRRDRPRPDVLGSKNKAKIGFDVPDFGLAAFRRTTGLERIEIGVEGALDGVAGRVALSGLNDAVAPFDPLGMRHGLGDALRLVDLWLEGSRNLNLRFEGSAKAAKSVDAYQYIDAKLTSVALDRPVGGLTAIVTMTLINPFESLLLVFKGEDEAIDAIDFLPFPSLVRGGVHNAERLIAGRGADDVADAAAVSADLAAAWMERRGNMARCVTSIEIDPAVHTGLEPVLNRDMLRWMSDTVGVRVNTPKSGSRTPAFIAELLDSQGRKPAVAGHTLHLPADCVPTIAALLHPLPVDAASQEITGGFGIADWNRHGRVWSVWQPSLGPAVEELQLVEAPQFAPSLTVRSATTETSRAIVLQWPLALAFREQPTRIGRAGPFEIASDRSGPLLRDQTVNSSQRLSVLVLGARASADETPLLQSLAQQAGVEIDEVLVCRATGEDDDDLIRELRRSFPERHKILTVAPTAGRLEQIAAARDLPIAEKVLVVDATTVLPDARTLATLAPMLDFPEVACAGCLLRAATEAMVPISAGYSLTQIDLRGAPAVSFSPIDPAVWRGPSTYPVVANSLSLLVTRRELLRTASAAGSTATRPESDDLLLGMHFIAQGRVNLCTTVVSAFTSARMRPSQATISVPYRVGPDELARIAETTTIVQRVA